MYQHFRRATATILVAALTLAASTVHAQSIFGAVEADDDKTIFYMLGGSWGLPGMGWHPYVALTAYHLRFESGATNPDRSVIVPALGLINRMSDGSFGGSLGYAFSDEDVSPAIVGAESGDGLVTSLQWNHWGSGNHNLQLLGSYNFGTEFFWTRGRASKPLSATSPLWVGGEAAFMGGGTGDVVIAQFGPMVEWRFNPQFRLGGSAGLKAGISNAGGGGVYGRLEFLWLPSAK